MIEVINSLFKIHLKKYQDELELILNEPLEIQQNVLYSILQQNKETAIGHKYSFQNIASYREFRDRVPVFTYDDLEPYIQRIFQGEECVLTESKVKWVAKTSGTTSGKSKYIPITKENIQECHFKGSWFTLAALYSHNEDIKIFARKNLLIGGGIYGNYPGSNIMVADISAIMAHHLPLIIRPFYIPDVRTATIPNWEEKVIQIAEMAAQEDSISMLGGVPTWNITLYRKILEITGASNLLEVWPELQAYIHGGVSFNPYRQQFRELIPSPDFLYQEVYNASEGFFAIQDNLGSDDLLLLLNNGVFYEFIPFEKFNQGELEAVNLQDVQAGESYAMLVSTNSGLYRYIVGDVVTFTAVNPFKIRIKGRTQEYINAFGEDLLLQNAENALMKACGLHDALVKDYTIAPFYLNIIDKGRHQWFIEFEKPPADVSAFETTLDQALQNENSNYAQKRTNDFAINRLEIIALPPGFFNAWLKEKGKIGGQHKVPKLVNDRHFANEFIAALRG
jgi:hypothetical protein